MTLRTAMLLLALLGGSSFAQADNLGEAIERARHLSVTEAVPASQPAIEALMNRLDEATPRQRVEIRLLHIRNLALQGDYGKAIDQIKELLGNPISDDQRLRALRLAANLGINVGQHEWGFAQLKAALELSGESDDLVERSRILSLAGFVHSIVGDHERAIDYATQSMAIAGQSDDKSQQCQAGQRLAVAFRYAERYEEAGAAARNALSLCRDVNDQIYTGTSELELGHLALERGDLAAAQRWTDRGLERLRQAGWVDGVLTGEYLQAQLAAERGESKQAIELAQELIERTEKRELWHRKSELHRLVAEQQGEREEFAEAYRHMVAHGEARDRFIDEDRARRLAILEVEVDVQRQEQELKLLREQRRVAELEAQSRRQQARVRWLAAGFAVFLFVILVLLLIHVLRERRHYRRLSELDGLTRVSNHTRFFDTARMLVEESSRSGHPLVLVLGDIDHFKQVNDEQGHIAGDKALRKVAVVLCENFPGLGHVGRIGGEEFAVCVPDARLEPVLEKLEHVRRDLANIQYGGNGKPLTMSFGVAALAKDEALENLRRRADEALYRAKGGGRNSVVVAEEDGAD